MEDDADASLNSGSAYLFIGKDATWQQEAKLVASDAGASDFFGYAVALEGETAVIGAHNSSLDGAPRLGAVYVFRQGDGGWQEELRVNPPEYSDLDQAGGDRFGVAVALSEETILVGADFFDTANPETGEIVSATGAAYEYLLTDAKYGIMSVEQPYGKILVQDDLISFEAVLIGDSTDITFTVRSESAVGLTGLNALVFGEHRADFAVVEEPDFTVDGIASTTFVVRFSPSGVGERTAFFQISSNDSSNSALSLELIGHGVVDVSDDPAFSPERAPHAVFNGTTGAGIVYVRSLDVPGRVYALQRSTDGINWIQIATTAADPSGAFSFRDPYPPAPSAFYRLAYPAE